MTLVYPRIISRDVGGASGRAGWPVDSGAGFNWASMIGQTIGYANRTPRLRGLGFDFDEHATPWYEDLLKSGLKVGSQIADWQLNPLYQKDTYQKTPTGVYASNVPGGSLLPTIGTGGGIGSMLPILLIGGLAILLIARR